MPNEKVPPQFWLEHLQETTAEPLIHFLFWVIVFEILTGVLLAIKQKRWTSKISSAGLFKHGLVFCFVLVVMNYADLLGYRTIGEGLTLAFLFNYAGSLMETWERSGIWFPDFLKPYINTLRKQQEERLNKLAISKSEIDAESIPNIQVAQLSVNKKKKRREKK